MEPSETVVGFFFGPLEAILGRQEAILGPLGAILAVLEACWAMLAAWVALLGRLGAFGEAQGGAMAAQGPRKRGPIHAARCWKRGGWVP